MERYAHADQVSALVSGLRARVFGLLDVPGFRDDLFDAVMAEFDEAEKRYVTWSTDQEIAVEVFESLSHD